MRSFMNSFRTLPQRSCIYTFQKPLPPAKLLSSFPPELILGLPSFVTLPHLFTPLDMLVLSSHILLSISQIRTNPVYSETVSVPRTVVLKL